MKSSITVVALFMFVQFGLSQGLQIGLRTSFGICTANAEEQFLLTPDNKLEYKLSFKKHSSSKAMGLFFQKKIGFIFIQPEILYRTTEVKFEMIDYLSREYSPHKMSEKYHQLHMPITAGMFVNDIRFGAGPVFNYMLDMDTPMNELANITERKQGWSYGFQAGIGYDFKNVSFDLKYEIAFTKIGEHVYHSSDKRAFRQNPNLLNIAVGFRL